MNNLDTLATFRLLTDALHNGDRKLAKTYAVNANSMENAEEVLDVTVEDLRKFMAAINRDVDIAPIVRDVWTLGHAAMYAGMYLRDAEEGATQCLVSVINARYKVPALNPIASQTREKFLNDARDAHDALIAAGDPRSRMVKDVSVARVNRVLMSQENTFWVGANATYDYIMGGSVAA